MKLLSFGIPLGVFLVVLAVIFTGSHQDVSLSNSLPEIEKARPQPAADAPNLAINEASARTAVQALPDITSVVPTPDATATLFVQLVDAQGFTVKGGSILLSDQEGRVIRESESKNNLFIFSNLSLGDYNVRVTATPPNYLLPRHQAGPNALSNYTAVQVTTGENLLSIVLETPVSISGHVVGPSGEPGNRIVVRCSSKEEGVRFLKKSEFPVQNGYYSGLLYEGEWQLEVLREARNLQGSEAEQNRPYHELMAQHPFGSFAQPLPLLRKFDSGSQNIVDFRYEQANGSIALTIRDEGNAPFAGLNLHLYRDAEVVSPDNETKKKVAPGIKSGVTDSEGQFTFKDLVSAKYRIQVEPKGFSPLAPPGKSTIGEIVWPIEIDLTDNQNSMVERTVRRAKPVLVEGEIHVSLASAKKDIPEATLVLPINQFRVVERRSKVKLDHGNSFSFYIEATESDALIEFTLGGEVMRYPLTSSSSSLIMPARLSLSFPQ